MPHRAEGLCPSCRGASPPLWSALLLGVITAISRGSLLVAFLFHAQLNNPIWPDAQPWDMWFFVAAAVLIALANRKALLDRERGMKEVLLPAEAVTLSPASGT